MGLQHRNFTNGENHHSNKCSPNLYGDYVLLIDLGQNPTKFELTTPRLIRLFLQSTKNIVDKISGEKNFPGRIAEKESIDGRRRGRGGGNPPES